MQLAPSESGFCKTLRRKKLRAGRETFLHLLNFIYQNNSFSADVFSDVRPINVRES
jgi:hypothetical protein